MNTEEFKLNENQQAYVDAYIEFYRKLILGGIHLAFPDVPNLDVLWGKMTVSEQEIVWAEIECLKIIDFLEQARGSIS